jgi:hypothetical protein
MGSRISQQTRHGRSTSGKISELTREFKRLQFKASQRFTSKAISALAKGTDYAYAEKLLYWRAAFPSESSLLVLDQYDLQVRWWAYYVTTRFKLLKRNIFVITPLLL